MLRRLALAGLLDARLAGAALADLAAVEIDRWEHAPFLRRAWELRSNVTIYDGLYVALAEALDAPFVTLDGRLAGEPGIVATIEVVGTG